MFEGVSMFEQASRLKLRFESQKGLLALEDLWDLPLTSAKGANLNDIAKGLNRELKNSDEEDFVNRAVNTNSVAKLKFEIVKHVIGVRLTENEAAKQAADHREKKQRLLELIAKKQDESLAARSVEELQAMVADL
jgi:hypothetical protein